MRVPVFLIFSFLIICFSSTLMASENIEKVYTSAPALNRVSDYVVSIDNKHVYVASDQSAYSNKKQNTTIFKLEIGEDGEFTRKSYYTFDSEFLSEQRDHLKIIPFAQDHILVTSSEYLFVMDTSGTEITLKYSYDLTTPEWQFLSKGIHYAEYSPYHNKIIGLTDVIQYVYGTTPEPFNTMLFSLRIEDDYSLAIDAVYDNQEFSQTYKPHSVAISETGRIFVGHNPDETEICPFHECYRENFVGTDTGEAILSEFSLTDNTFTLQSTFLDSNEYTANSSVITTIKLHNNQLFAYDSGAGNILIVDVSSNIKLEQIISDDIPQFSYTKWAALGVTQGHMDINKDASLIAVSNHDEHALVYQKNNEGVFEYKNTYRSPVNSTGQCAFDWFIISAANKVLFMPDGSTLIKEQQNCENSYAGLYVLLPNYHSNESTELIPSSDSYLGASKIYSNQQGSFLIEGHQHLFNTSMDSGNLIKTDTLWSQWGTWPIMEQKYVNNNKELIILGNEGGVYRLSLSDPDIICSVEEFDYNYPAQILSSPDARYLFIFDWLRNQVYGEDARYSGVVQIFKAEENEGGHDNCFTSIMTSSLENSISWEEARQVQSVSLGSSFITKLASTNAFAVFQLNQNSGEFETKPNIDLSPELQSEFVAAKADNSGQYLFIFTKTLGIQKYKWDESSATITYDSTINYSFQGELTSVEKFSSSVSTPLSMLHLQYKDLSGEQSSEFQVLNLNAIDAYYEYYDFDGIATADGLTDVDISSDGQYIAGVNSTQELVYLYKLGPLDSDGDGILDENDAFPSDPNEYLDTDGDGIGNNADTDDDGDGVPDTEDAFPLDATESVDTDGDGIGNNADTDDDGDSVPDTEDAFPLDATESVDTDGDGIGNNADSDDDGDGVLDSADAYPLDASRSSIPVDETNNSSSGGSFSVYLLILLTFMKVVKKQMWLTRK